MDIFKTTAIRRRLTTIIRQSTVGKLSGSLCSLHSSPSKSLKPITYGIRHVSSTSTSNDIALSFSPSLLNTAVAPDNTTAAESALVIFDKDGTLIDFDEMWRGWIEAIAWKLEKKCELPVREKIFDVLGYDASSRSVKSNAMISTNSLQSIFSHIASLLHNEGVTEQHEADSLVRECWRLPDPVRMSQPKSADLRQLFLTIKSVGAKIAIITLDDRDRTESTLDHLQIRDLVDGLACGDDDVPAKPNPDQIWALCGNLGVSPSQSIIVGDTSNDMQLGRAAGCALSVGVLGGSTSTRDLARDADMLIPTLDGVINLVSQYTSAAR